VSVRVVGARETVPFLEEPIDSVMSSRAASRTEFSLMGAAGAWTLQLAELDDPGMEYCGHR
jgi:hypothetical protein